MRHTIIIPILAGLVLASLLGGCSLKNPPAQKHFHRIPTLDISNPEAGSLLPSPLSLALRPLATAPEFDTHFFLYRLSETEFTPDFYNEFMASPANGITRILRHHLRAQGDLVPATTAQPPQARLSGTLTQIHADVRIPEQPRAVLTLSLLLEYQTKGQYRPWFQKRYNRSLDVSHPTPDLLVQAWARAMAEITSELIRDIRTTPLP